MNKISIIIPIYNSEKYLYTCLTSIVNQSYKDIEIICIDDASNDNSLNIINEYKEKDNRIKVISLKENKGVSNARNIGIENATSKYLCFVDSDDSLDLKFCEESWKNKVLTNSDLVCGRRVLKNENGSILKIWVPKFDISRHPIRDCDLFTQYHMVTDKLFKTNIIKQNNLTFDVNLQYAEDSLFLTQYLTHCKIITNSKNSIYFAVENKQSLSRNPEYKERIKIQRELVLKKNKEIIDNYNKKEKHD